MIQRKMITQVDPLELIGRCVRERRAGKGLSQIELAAMAGIRQGTLSDVERGKDVRVSTLIRVANALEVDLADLVRG